MIVGESVVVSRRTQTGVDRLGDPVYSWIAEPVDDVLVAPGPRADVPVSVERGDGRLVRWNLHFPKCFPATLAGARVSVRGGEFLDVVGDPQHYTDANTPGRWSMPVELWRADG